MFQRIQNVYKRIMESSIPNAPKTYCLYWMQQSMRVSFNHALSHAINLSNVLELPLLVCYVLDPKMQEFNLRQYTFMVEGLSDVANDLKKRNIGFLVLSGDTLSHLEPYLSFTHTLVMDQGYLRQQRLIRETVSKRAKDLGVLGIDLVESDVVVPVETASDQEAYMARTIRPKIQKQLTAFLDQCPLPEVSISYRGPSVFEPKALLKQVQDTSVLKSPYYHGGYREAKKRLEIFLEDGLWHYHESNSPAKDYTSKMSLYLRYGQISPLEIYHIISDYANEHDHLPRVALEGFLEQLVVRRELAINYVAYREGYDQFETMTNPWAYATMALHEQDLRPIVYDLVSLENYQTHDPYWNDAMKEMVITGYMHNYMRMYWCKKIIEWSRTYKEAYNNALYLNNKYFIDGFDPNSYTGVAWCFGLHDQGFKERQIFGKLRYMNDKGLLRKFDMQAYHNRTASLN